MSMFMVSITLASTLDKAETYVHRATGGRLSKQLVVQHSKITCTRKSSRPQGWEIEAGVSCRKRYAITNRGSLRCRDVGRRSSDHP